MKQEKLELKVGNVYEAYLHYEDDDRNRSFFAMLLMAIVRKRRKSYFVCYKQMLSDTPEDKLEIDTQYIHIFDEYGEEIEYDYAIGFYLTGSRAFEEFEVEDGKHGNVWDIRHIKPEFRVINKKVRP